MGTNGFLPRVPLIVISCKRKIVSNKRLQAYSSTSEVKGNSWIGSLFLACGL